MNSSLLLDILHQSNLSAVDVDCINLESWDYVNISARDLHCLSGTSYFNDSEISAFYFYETEQLAFLWLLFFFIVVGNSAVLLALVLAKGRRSRMNFFITHLALADLSVGLISVATDIAWKMTVAWHAGNIACKVIRFFQVLVTYSSTYVLIALSIDRCDAITHPMNFCGGWRRAKILVASSWILSAVFSSPILFLYERKIVQGKPQCWIDLQEGWQWKLYMSLVALALFIIPTIIISGCYLIIVYTIWKKSTGMDHARVQRTSNTSGGGSQPCPHEELEKRVSSRGVIPRAKMKTVKMTFVIVSVFVLCWSPYIIFDLLQVFGHIPNTQTMVAVATFMQSLAPLNSATNPIVYCLFSTRLCRNLRKIPLFDWFARKIVGCVRCQAEPALSTYQIVKGKAQPPASRTTSSDPTQSITLSSSSSQISKLPHKDPPIAKNFCRTHSYRITPEIRPEKRFSRKSFSSDLNSERQRYAKAKTTDKLVSSLFEFEAIEMLLSADEIGRAPLAEMELSSS